MLSSETPKKKSPLSLNFHLGRLCSEAVSVNFEFGSPESRDLGGPGTWPHVLLAGSPLLLLCIFPFKTNPRGNRVSVSANADVSSFPERKYVFLGPARCPAPYTFSFEMLVTGPCLLAGGYPSQCSRLGNNSRLRDGRNAVQKRWGPKT